MNETVEVLQKVNIAIAHYRLTAFLKKSLYLSYFIHFVKTDSKAETNETV
jgi:hypothetical protein